MAEPTLTTKQDVLDKLAFEAKFARSHGSELTAAGLAAIAAWLSAACVVEHDYGVFVDLPECKGCGQRRADAPEGGR